VLRTPCICRAGSRCWPAITSATTGSTTAALGWPGFSCLPSTAVPGHSQPC